MKAHLKRNAIFYLLIGGLSLLSAYLYFAGAYTASQLRDQAEDQRQEALFYAHQAVDEAGKAPLRLMAQSLGWAVRAEVLNDNRQEAKRYLQAICQDPAVQAAALCDTLHTVALASPPEWEGKAFSQFHPEALLHRNDVSVDAAPNGQGYFLTVPIMGLSRRQGTLFIHYRSPKP